MSYRILVRKQNADLAGLFLAAMEDYPFVLLTPSEENLDWCDSEAVAGYINEKSPNLIIHFTEQYRTASERDIQAARAMALASKAKNLPFIQLSSFEALGEQYVAKGVPEDYPFTGAHQDEPFRILEQQALLSPVALVLRLPWVLDTVSGCLFDALNPGLKDAKISAVSDHHRLTLIHSHYLVRSLIALIQQIFCGAANWGVFHLRGSDSCSEAELVDTIVRMLNSEGQLDLQMPSVLSGNDGESYLRGSANLLGRRCTDEFGIQFPSWRHGFKSQVKRWLHDNALVPDLRKIDR